jgi:hypothetical protein
MREVDRVRPIGLSVQMTDGVETVVARDVDRRARSTNARKTVHRPPLFNHAQAHPASVASTACSR